MVCAREMRFYAKRSPKLCLVDISSVDFDSAAHGLPHSAFMEKIHARDAQGKWYVGIDAFQVVWRVVPGRLYDLMADLIGWPVVRPVAECGYRLFARYRHLLPRHEASCTEENCRWPRI